MRFQKVSWTYFFSWGSVSDKKDDAADSAVAKTLDQDQLRIDLKKWLSSKLGLSVDSISDDSAFIDLGLDSMLMVEASDHLMNLTVEVCNRCGFG